MKIDNWKKLFCCVSLLGLLAYSSEVFSQSFSPVNIRDFSEMKNNYGNAVADYDQDGDLDVFIVAYDPYDSSDPTTWSRLLENIGSGQFVNSTSEANLLPNYTNRSEGKNKIGSSWGDYNNDGFPDLLLTNAGSIQLYHNNGDKTFNEITTASNLTTCDDCVNTSGLWWDFDRDGDLDIYISNYEGENQLFQNEGNGAFLELSRDLGVNDGGSTWCSIAMDVNKDNWIDLYVINDYGLSRLYLNDNGSQFHLATEEFGLRNTGNGMGPAIGDYNNDGNLDLYVTNIADLQPNVLFSMQPNGKYTDRSFELGVGDADWGWGSAFFDADHDGDEDLYAVNGFNSLNYKNRFFKNLYMEGQDGFVDWSQQSSTDGFANGMATQVFDYDDDGDLDILVSNTNDHPYVFRNMGAGGNWLKVSLEGTVSNRDALGAIVKIVANDITAYRYNYCAGIMSQSLIPLHFGLGPNNNVDSLIIQWPNGQEEIFLDIDANQLIRVIEKQEVLTATNDLFQDEPINNGLSILNVSPNPFEDFVSVNFKSSENNNVDFRVYSIMGDLLYQEGRRVQARKEDVFTWNTSGFGPGRALSSGMYLFSLKSSSDYVLGKIIKE